MSAPAGPVTGRTVAAVRDREAALSVSGLGVATRSLQLVHDLSFAIHRGERVGLIGESGCGKSLTALAIMGLLPENLHVSGSVRLGGLDHDLVGASERRLSRLRGRRISMVFQEPMTALNPLMRVGDQVAEVLLVHDTAGSRRAARRQALDLLHQVRMRDPEAMQHRFPHQLSGGQRQRAMLAIALANGPDVLICDEPTTALDVTVQAQVLDLVVRGVEERDAALLFITHDLAVVATVCERVMVMYGGHIVEAGPIQRVFTRPRHPYTQGLLAASDLGAIDAHGDLPTIPGSVPGPGRFPDGCVFRNRCPNGDDQCRLQPPWTVTADGGFACWHPVDDGSEDA